MVTEKQAKILNYSHDKLLPALCKQDVGQRDLPFLKDCPAILLDESSEGMHSVFAISSRLPSGSAAEWAGDSNPARWSYILQEHSFGTGTTVGQRLLGMSIQKWRVCVCVTDRQRKVSDARPCVLGLLVCNRVAVRILAKTPGLSARAHEVQRSDSQVQNLLICCGVHWWTCRKSSCPVPCNYPSFLKFQQAVQLCTQDSHSIKVGRCFQILGNYSAILQAASVPKLRLSERFATISNRQRQVTRSC